MNKYLMYKGIQSHIRLLIISKKVRLIFALISIKSIKDEYASTKSIYHKTNHIKKKSCKEKKCFRANIHQGFVIDEQVLKVSKIKY